MFVDTGAWLALSDRRDGHHEAARLRHRDLALARRPLLTTNLVMGEAYILIRRAAGVAYALRFLDALNQTSRLQMVFAGPGEHSLAEAILRQYADQDFSLVDAVSFAVMKGHGLRSVFGFDQHFVVAGYQLLQA